MWAMASSHRDLTRSAEEVLERVRLTHLAHQPITALPHGDQRKVEVAVLIAMQPRVFMFDEPTAGMSLEEAPVILDLIAGIKRDPTVTVLLVEHKMDVIRSLSDRIVVLHNGALVADGLPAEVMASRVVQEAYLGKELTDV
jgi:branched-chain amino acid transport system ATP-binding protein